MQDITLAQCQQFATDAPLTLTDTRDNNTYTVRYINGNCWMTQNLRLAGGRTLASADSNVASSWEFPSTELADNGESYTEPQMTISSDTSYGGYYNFCAASAGTNCQNYNSTINNTFGTDASDTIYDICPAGWRLPTENELVDVQSYASAFSPVTGGFYSNGSLNMTDYGYWWSSRAFNDNNQFYMYYYGNGFGSFRFQKPAGFSVRCIKGEPGIVTINFDGNGATGGNTASQQIAAGNTANLNANGFTRTNYAFTGWNTAADGSGISYSDQASYTVTPATGDATVTLYAQWEAIPTTMQDITLAQCQQFATDAPLTLTDTRDGSDYTVRYINGNCWMTQNLRLAGGTTITSADSNVSSSYRLPTDSTSGFNSYTVANMHYSGNTATGAWYNFCAASAGTVCSQTMQDATYDICPKGWRLPTYNEQQGITSYASAFSPVTGGYYNTGSLYVTSYGYWWSSTASGSNYQYRLRYNGSSLYTFGDNKYVGFYVRCVRSS